MTISIDSSLIAALLDDDHTMNRVAVKVLGRLSARERLVVSGIDYVELMAGRLRDEESLNLFFADTGIEIDWAMGEAMWREAGRAYRGYATRRKKSGGGDVRRILTDFLIGAHALARGYALLTLNSEDFRTAFPALRIISA
jgi:predicted nucleic acid-binding protein